MRRYAIYALCGAMVIGASPALAQSIPEGQSCGGLLCDMGVFGHKTAPKSEPAPAPVPASVKQAEIVPAPAATLEPADPQPKKAIVHKKKRIAKAVIVPKPASAPVPVATDAKVTAVASKPSAPRPSAPTVAASPTPQQAPAFHFRPLYNF